MGASCNCQQEARRIVVAQWQHVVYNEWLPIILGRQFMERFGLYPLTSGYSNDYRCPKYLIITKFTSLVVSVQCIRLIIKDVSPLAQSLQTVHPFLRL